MSIFKPGEIIEDDHSGWYGEVTEVSEDGRSFTIRLADPEGTIVTRTEAELGVAGWESDYPTGDEVDEAMEKWEAENEK